jgi:hypothetical protein
VIFPILYIGFILLTGLAALRPQYRPWAATSFLLAVCSSFGALHVRRRYALAQLIRDEPEQIYWVHAPDVQTEITPATATLILHLRNGQRFEADLPTSEMSAFINWLKTHSTSARWGVFD